MNITQITKAAGAHKRRKRVGRGESSGHGKTSGRGTKGAGSRTGWKRRILWEGGEMEIFRRIPKRGFSNFHFRTEYQVVNVADLEARFSAGGTVDKKALAELGLIAEVDGPLKILGEGTLTKKLSISAERFSKQAEQKIQQAGGTVTKLGPQPKKKFVKRPPPPKAEAEDKGKGKGGDAGKEKKGKPKGEAPAGGEKKKPKAGGPEAAAE